MAAYYSEWEPFAADWLRNLIRAGLIPPGEVDTRDIRDVAPDDLRGFDQCHFFAGVGGWALAFRLAGVPDAAPWWSGSCPCQPFSSAGKRAGEADDRHLWPEFHRLIAERRPVAVFGEQVAGKDGLRWLDGVHADCRSSGYAFGACDLPAAGVGAPHIRQRLFWVADRHGRGRGRVEERDSDKIQDAADGYSSWPDSDGCGVARGVEHPASHGRGEGRAEPVGRGVAGGRGDGGLGDPVGGGVRGGGPEPAGGATAGASGTTREQRVRADPGPASGVDGAVGVGNPDGTGHQVPERKAVGRAGRREEGRAAGESGGPPACGLADADGRESGDRGAERSRQHGQQPADRGTGWSHFRLVHCRDGKTRRFGAQPGDEPLAHGIPSRRIDPRLGYLLARLGELGFDPKTARRMVNDARRNRVGRLRGYGNAIVARAACQFVLAYMEATGCGFPARHGGRS